MVDDQQAGRTVRNYIATSGPNSSAEADFSWVELVSWGWVWQKYSRFCIKSSLEKWLQWEWFFLDDRAEEAEDADDKNAGSQAEDYALTIKENWMNSVMKIAADHDVVVKGDIKSSDVHNLACKH